MNFRVLVQPRAQRDIAAIFHWIAERSPNGAQRWAERCDASLRLLSDNPHQFGLAPENDAVPQEIRHVIFSTRKGLPYRILFWIEATTVHVVHVRGPGQQPLTSSEMWS